MFERHDHKKTESVFYRITQIGAELFLDHMDGSRKSQIGLKSFLFLVKTKTMGREELPEFLVEDLKAVLESSLLGYFCVYVKGDDGEISEVGVIQKFPKTLHLLMNKKDALGIRIKYSKEMSQLEGVEEATLGAEFSFLGEITN